MDDYRETYLEKILEINNVVSVHYFEFAKNYVFHGERHDFWEFVYVDKGVVEVMADETGYKLEQGEILFHKPGEFHNLWADGITAPNIIVISFYCNSPSMHFFESRLMKAGNRERELLSNIIKEAAEAFATPLASDYKALTKRENSKLACEQLISIYLEQLLILLMRVGTSIILEARMSSAVKARSDTDMVSEIISFLKGKVYENISFEDVCKHSNISKTNLKTIFKEKTSKSVIGYFKGLKIEEAKRMIREESLNFTEISERLGYSSIHYFSRHFKKVTNMTPSEYSLSVKAT
jgi:AraC-like DNA-binding protein